MLKAYEEATGKEVKIGETITDFRGEKSVLRNITRARAPGKSGKVCNDNGEYYDKVFGLIVVEE